MAYLVYILKSTKDNKYYIGQTSDVEQRLNAHNNGSVPSTKNRRPLILIFQKEFSLRSDAMKYEKHLKQYKNTEKFLCSNT